MLEYKLDFKLKYLTCQGFLTGTHTHTHTLKVTLVVLGDVSLSHLGKLCILLGRR